MTCPVCGDNTATQWRPFCSRRCADVDLGRWLSGGYALPLSDPETAEPNTDRPADSENDRKRMN